MPERHLPVRRILLAGLAFAVTIAVAIAVVATVLHMRGLPLGGPAVARPAPLEVSPTAPSTLALSLPRLQAAPQVDRTSDRLEKVRALGELGWADAARTTAHVPVRVAMAMMVARSASAAMSGSVAASASASAPVQAPASSMPSEVPRAPPAAPVMPSAATPSASAAAIEPPASRAAEPGR